MGLDGRPFLVLLGVACVGAPVGLVLLWHRVPGVPARIHDQAWALLPPGYENPANAHRTYPLVEFLPGYPGEPSTWVHALHLADAMDALISTGQVQPFVAVVPSITVAPSQDTEC